MLTSRGPTSRGADLIGADLTWADLAGANLTKADLRGAKLRNADLTRADLTGADLTGANLRDADIEGANLIGANLAGAKLIGADLTWARLIGADLTGADLTNADISYAILVETNFTNAALPGCRVYGCSAWDLTLQGAEQRDLVISRRGEPLITVDDLEVAQFIYLLLNNEKIRDVIDTITSKVVLILGRFTPERKAILDALREELRKCEYLPILFDFDKPASRSFTETVSTLAHMARFVIADITEAKSIPQELQKIVPGLPHVPVQPLLLAGDSGYAMFEDLRFYPWVLPTFIYHNEQMLLASIKKKIIDPAVAKAKEQAAK